MKAQKYFYIGLIVVSCVLLAIFVPKLLKKGKGSSANLPVTTLTVAKEVIDLGDVPQNIPAPAVFALTNTGQNSLVISNVTPDCHCTAAEWDQQPVAPGQTTYIKTSYDSRAPGVFQKLIQVTANVPDSIVVLVLRGNVVAR